MTDGELLELLKHIQKIKTETSNLEVKAAHKGTPEKLYDTLSSFSNKDDGGIIVFGVDEANDFKEVGVYDADKLQKNVAEQCKQMEPKVRALFTAVEKDGLTFVSAEIPGIDIADRPCFYTGKGRIRGSYVRVGDADEPMTEYEVYSYEAFRKKYQDDIRVVENAALNMLDPLLLGDYLLKLKTDRPNLSNMSDSQILELMSLTKSGKPTLAAVMLFGLYPQVLFPQLSITAIVVPGNKIGDVGSQNERFIDSRRIEGTIPQMLDGAMSFVRKNIKTSVVIDKDGKRTDRPEYPLSAVREAVLNALIHRDYSIHTEGKPIQLVIYKDRLEVTNPGGLYGRMSIDQLGKVQPDTRNPKIATIMELLNKTENRYSGIPTIYREMRLANLPEPVFFDSRGEFVVKLYNGLVEDEDIHSEDTEEKSYAIRILDFCKTPKNRQEIAEMLGLKSVAFAIDRYVMPLIGKNLLAMTLPDKPRSKNQKYYTV